MTPTVIYGAYIEVKKLTGAVMISCLCYFFQHCICEESDRLSCGMDMTALTKLAVEFYYDSNSDIWCVYGSKEIGNNCYDQLSVLFLPTLHF